ncbi:hypothetical protein [Mucilaginibacter aquariorum]|nr:hypothetical protein [Mucilaginibacter aquariorum]
MLAILMLAGCHTAGGNFLETGDQDLNVQIGRLQPTGSPGENADRNFKIKLVPKGEAILTAKKNETALMFAMDSCFSLKQSGRQIYPAMVQQVPNGVKGTYEYLVIFPTVSLRLKDSVEFRYQDKNISKKSYTLNLLVQ